MAYLQYLVLLCLTFSCSIWYFCCCCCCDSVPLSISQNTPSPPYPLPLSYWGSLLPVVSQSIPRLVIFPLLSQLRFLPRSQVYSTIVTCSSYPVMPGLCAHPYDGNLGCCCFSYLVPKAPCGLPLALWLSLPLPLWNYQCFLPLLFPLWILIPQRGPLNGYILFSLTLFFRTLCALPGWLHQGWLPCWFYGPDAPFHLQVPLMSLANFVTIKEKLFLLQG